MVSQIRGGITTPLLEILRLATPDERIEFAALAQTKPGYLYQLGARERKSTSIQLAVQIEAASRVMHARTGGRLPTITARQIADMLGPGK